MTDTGTISSVILAGSLGAVKLFAGGAPLPSGVTAESGNLLLNAIGAVLLAIIAYYLKEDRKDFKRRLEGVEVRQAIIDRRVVRLLAHNEYQTPLITKLAGLHVPPDIDREIRKIEEPNSPSDV